MRTVLFHEHGGPDVLEVGEFETPQPGHGEVQINLKAAALNRLDLFVRNGWPGIKLEYPHIPGADGAGVISAVGEGVTEVAVGDRVVINGTISCGKCEFCLAGENNRCFRGGILGEHFRGTYAEYVVVGEQNVMKLPDHVSFEEAAAASLVFLTAWHSLITRCRLRPGESVLGLASGGRRDTASIQIARLAGASPVIVVGSTAAQLEQARALGADILINRSEEDWGRAVYRLTNKRGVDVVVEIGRASC